MHIRDKEIQRLIKYAEGMNVSVLMEPYIPFSGDSAEWDSNGTRITIFIGKRDSKLYTILSLIHELGHHLEFVHSRNRVFPERLNDAYINAASKLDKKMILDFERKSAEWWETIYKETDMKFPIYLLYKQREFDIWQYEVLYETGEFPTKNQMKIKLRELREKYND